MAPALMQTRPSLSEFCIAALMEAADGIEAANDTAAFKDALNANFRVWLVVRECGVGNGWAVPTSREAEFVIQGSSGQGRGVNDDDIGAIIAINRRVAHGLAAGGDIARIRTRAVLAYREGGGGGGFAPWMVGQIYEKGCLRSAFDPTSEHGRLRPIIRAAAVSFIREAEQPGP
ncbi:conserved protein of unknown function [Magnetospirillum sp. XM-1]|uniref:hypothetical protein n=1 Tax=Magnetospirillum sp. XM-1 TaxID=1663591 RepID=UPI00073DE563|nr:hypothetical protein [Magnetospirillum sp. XM-1]CUW39653.1 conserved protein of unknown function [Magnetospirillum sp. XM-1]